MFSNHKWNPKVLLIFFDVFYVQELYSLGARNIAIAGLPPIGCLPIQMTAKFRNIFGFCLEQENKDSVVYNQKLQKQIPQMQASLTGSKILYSDIYNPIYDMMQNPSKYGIDIVFLVPQVFQ